MADTIHLEVVTPDRLMLEADVESVQIPGLEGELGILPGHARLISQLRPSGLLTYVAGGTAKQLVISEGFVEVTPTNVNVLAETAEQPDEINVTRAIAAKERAEREIAQASSDPAIDLDAAYARLERANARLQITSRK